jgi:hypothetical protein
MSLIPSPFHFVILRGCESLRQTGDESSGLSRLMAGVTALTKQERDKRQGGEGQGNPSKGVH